MSRKVKIEQLNSAVIDILDQYVDEIADGTDEAADAVSKKCLKDIRSAAKSTFNGNKYWKSWKRTENGTRRGYAGYTIHSTIPGLPHLLEKGHAQVNGGHTDGRPHIAPAEAEAVKEFQRRVEEVIRNASG